MQKLIYNDYKNAKKVLTTLKEELLLCEEFFISVAFISESGVVSLLETLSVLEEKNIKGKILTTNYLYFNTPKVLEKLSTFKNIELKIFDTKDDVGFHTKGYIFKKKDNYSILIGSSNLTASALSSNKEWNTLTYAKLGDEFLDNTLKNFYTLWDASHSYKSFKKIYEKDFLENIKNISKENSLKTNTLTPTPNVMQKSFLKKFLNIRKDNNKALLISATGTGKTYAASFAMESIAPKKLLFVVHREQIAKEALNTFRKILKNKKTYSLLSGNVKNFDADFIFATIQTLTKDDVLKNFSKNYFDEIIIDEVHRAGANSYQKIINYFTPTFLLGMSATPDRTDGFNIYNLFDNNIVYEIRLKDALEENLLCPFHYFAISDLVVKGMEIDEFSSFNKLTSDERVKHIIQKINFYSYSGTRPCGLIFCSTKEEAKALSEKFNEHKFKTSYLTGEDSIKKREETIKKLTTDDKDYLEYIFTVDIFNEGVDIPKINQIIMLRPTKSSIIFLQQLGRGLRKSKTKDFLVVLDFIANYKNNFLIPKALSFNTKEDKDSYRKFLTQGTTLLPGTSTVNFDKIARKKIYNAIDNVKLNTYLSLKEDYTALKNRLNKIPSYYDIEESNLISVLKFFRVTGSYEEFLSKQELSYREKFDTVELENLKFISQNLILSKKIEELIILKTILENEKDFLKIYKKTMLDKYNKTITNSSLLVSIKILTNNYVTSSVTKKKFKNSSFLEENYTDIVLNKNFKERTKNNFLKKVLFKLVNFGIYYYDKNYKNNLYKNTNFVLYEKYSLENVCKLFNWEINYVPLAIGGYKYDEKTKTLPVFINYDIDENSFNHDYTHGFLPNNHFTSMSKPKRNLKSKEMIYFTDEKTKIYLFMRKNKLDKDNSTEYYFLGEMFSTKTPKLIHRKKSKDTVLKFFFKLLTPLRDDLYNYFTKDKV